MSTPGRRVAVRLEYLGHQLGLWCNTCLISSGVRVCFAATTAGRLVLQSTAGCAECGGRDVVEQDHS